IGVLERRPRSRATRRRVGTRPRSSRTIGRTSKMNAFVASRVCWTMPTSCPISAWAWEGSRSRSRSTIWACRTMLVRLWAGPSCMARAISRRRSSWAASTSRETAGGSGVFVSSLSAVLWGTAPPMEARSNSALYRLRLSLNRVRTLRLPSRTSTCDSMMAERRVRAISGAVCCPSAPSVSKPDAVLSLSSVCERFVSWWAASFRACWTSPSISPISLVRRSTSRRARSAISSIESGSASRATRGSVLGHTDPALAHGVDDGLSAVVDAQFAQDAGHMVLDGLFADREGVGDLLVGHSLGDVVQDFYLARREGREDRRGFLAVDGKLAELLEDAAGDGRLGKDLVVDEVLARCDAADDRNQVGRGHVLEDERGRACLDGVEESVLVLVDCQNDDPRRRQLALDSLCRLDATGRRQREVHQDDIGRELDR